jgi:small subunit ribosomal protein S20
VRTAVKSARTAAERGDLEQARATVSRTARLLDKAVTKGVLHRNAAARRKSRLSRLVNALPAR